MNCLAHFQFEFCSISVPDELCDFTIREANKFHQYNSLLLLYTVALSNLSQKGLIVQLQYKAMYSAGYAR